MKILQLIPELLVEDVSKSLHFYREILKFESQIVFPRKKPIFAQVGRDNIQIMFYKRSEFEKEIPKLKTTKIGGSLLIVIKAKDIKTFFRQIKEKAEIIQPFHKTDYGTFEFMIKDCNGYLIAFSESISIE